LPKTGSAAVLVSSCSAPHTLSPALENDTSSAACACRCPSMGRFVISRCNPYMQFCFVLPAAGDKYSSIRTPEDLIHRSGGFFFCWVGGLGVGGVGGWGGFFKGTVGAWVFAYLNERIFSPFDRFRLAPRLHLDFEARGASKESILFVLRSRGYFSFRCIGRFRATAVHRHRSFPGSLGALPTARRIGFRYLEPSLSATHARPQSWFFGIPQEILMTQTSIPGCFHRGRISRSATELHWICLFLVEIHSLTPAFTAALHRLDE